MKKKIIVSLEGGWAAGKTSILKSIAEKGENIFTSIVPFIYDVKGRGSYSPRDNPEEFTQLFLKFKEKQFKKAMNNESKIMFFDRMFFAPIVLRKFFGLEVPGIFYDLAKNKNLSNTVFLIEPIPLNIHKNGWPRQHFSYTESLRYHQITKDVITQLGFNIYEIPYLTSINERAKLILNKAEELKEKTKPLIIKP